MWHSTKGRGLQVQQGRKGGKGNKAHEAIGTRHRASSAEGKETGGAGKGAMGKTCKKQSKGARSQLVQGKGHTTKGRLC
jgi:hypothetical protein